MVSAMNDNDFEREYEKFCAGGEVSRDFLNYIAGDPELAKQADRDSERYWGFRHLVNWIVSEA